MAIRRRIDVDVYSHPEQFVAGMVEAGAAAATFGTQLTATAAKAMAGSGATDIAAAGAVAAEKTSASFLGKFQSSLQTGFGKLGKGVLTDAGAAIGGETGATFANAFGSSAISGVGAILPELVAAFAAFEIGKEIFRVAGATAQYEDQVRSLKIATGGTAEEASKLAAEMRVLGVDVTSTTRPIGTLAKELDAGGGPLRKYLSDAEIAHLRNQDLAKSVGDLANKYQSIQDPVERDAFLMAAFGARGVSALRPLLQATEEQRRAIDDAASAQHLLFTDSQLEQAHSYQLATRELSETFKGLEFEIGNAVIPILTSFLGGLDNIVLGAERAGHSLNQTFGSGSKWLNFPEAFHLIGKTFQETTYYGSLGQIDLRTKSDQTNKSIADQAAAFDAASQANAAYQQQLQDTAAGEDAVTKGAEAIANAVDPLKSISFPDPTQAAQQAADATDKVTSAQERLQSVEERIAQNKSYLTRTPQRDRELASDIKEQATAERELKKARDDANAAKRPVAQTVESDYKSEVSKMTRFVKELDDAARKGVDPAFLQKAIADPDKYLPILDALEHDTKGSLETTINSSEQQLRTIGTRLQAASAAVGESVAEAVQGGAGKLTGGLADVFHEALTAPKSEIYSLAVAIGLQIKSGVVTGMNGAGTATEPALPGNKTAKPSSSQDPNALPSQSDRNAYENYLIHGGDLSPQAWWQKYGRYHKTGYGGTFAAGGFNVPAHIAYSPEVLFGESSTGGEAYIPLGGAHRGRSSLLLAEVAQMFGYGLIPLARGGIMAGSWSNGGTSGPVSRSVQHRYFENAHIVGPSMAEIERHADRRRRQSALMGAM